ncbi:hypothetical protein CROQUDRAFT_30897, partial [Cronartium quercuum f. sp. fusiforme G11]
PQATDQLTKRVKQAWELWYYQKVSVEECAERMGIKPASVATYIGRAAMTLGEVVEDRERLKELVVTYGLCRRLKVNLGAF